MVATLPTSQRAVLYAFRDRLIDQIEYLTDSTCKVTDEAMPSRLFPVAPRRFVTIAMGPGRFNTEAYTGGGSETLNEVSRVYVSLFHQTRFDSIGESEKRLFNEEDGMLAAFKYDVLKAIAKDWMPTDSSGNGLLRNYPQPITASPPQKLVLEGEQEFIGMTIDFDASFDWDLA